MRIIKLNATQSTNTYLRQLSQDEPLVDFTVVTANFQTQGKGQMGAKWQSQASQNLMFSVFKDLKELLVEHNFYISIVVALALINTLDELEIEDLSIKWPNDILSGEKKICGVLIENVIKGQGISSSIIGVGLNVNQTQFDNLPQASSLKSLTGKTYDLDDVLYKFLQQLTYFFKLLEAENYSYLKKTYEALLFRKGKKAQFKDKHGLVFYGEIVSVSNLGQLQIRVEQTNEIKTFEKKEVTFIY